MGNENAQVNNYLTFINILFRVLIHFEIFQSLVRLQNEVEREMYDAVIHVGDFAYDMDTLQALVGDAFMNQIQPIAGYVPYMVCPGNHEAA